ncbi:Porin subfamily protein [Bosea sp. CRIB-10]|uniref:porin n=1 Tax=Bosea sp. CRIB-10 TaxID=378404 RepID=UPI0008F04DE9|nr:porin [Bosea sp. CRIB-10]SFC90697.1 Porin subfamily protein [Bosea sp. CRIB-10]
MKLVKSLLLGSAAGIAAVAGAQAADLPSRKAAPVEYVRVCSAYGAGFFYIPGTDTCLRVGGRVRAEYTVGTRYGSGQDAYGTRSRGRLNVDARTATAYGTLRTFFRYELTVSSGFYGGTTNGNQGVIAPGTGRNTGATTASNLDLAFVQFGPITAGRAQSFFDFYANDFGFSTLRTADSRLNLLAYTATFGSGFSATISLEDRNTGTGVRENGAFGRFTGTGLVLGGQDFPDVVASLRVDQGWGSAQLSGALTQRKVLSTFNAAGVLTQGSADEYGFAIQGGVKINLPMLAAGDHLFLQAAYADGALGYLGWGGQIGPGRLASATTANQLLIGDIGVSVLGNTKSSTGWSIVAGLRHFWTPQLRSELYGSYSEIKLGYLAPAGFYAPGAAIRPLDPKEFIVAGNLIWSPVSGLDIGVEVLYTRTELASRVLAVNNAGNRIVGVGIKNDDAWAGRLRIQRDF